MSEAIGAKATGPSLQAAGTGPGRPQIVSHLALGSV